MVTKVNKIVFVINIVSGGRRYYYHYYYDIVYLTMIVFSQNYNNYIARLR